MKAVRKFGRWAIRKWEAFRTRFVEERSANRRWAEIREANYGREAGWYVEWRGQQIAELTDSRLEETFWDSYRWAPLTDDDELRVRMSDPAFWRTERLTFRNRRFDEVAPNAFSPGILAEEPNRLLVRGLYLWRASGA